MLEFRFSLRTLLLAIAVVAVYFPVREIYEPWRRHRLQSTHQMFSDFETLAILNEGDSVQDVSHHYPMLSVVPPRTPAWDQIADVLRTSKLPVESTDDIYKYTLNEQGMFGYLQFRNGNLINHPTEAYSDPVANTIRNGAILPGAFDRIGFPAIYFTTVALACAILFMGTRVYRTLRSNDPET